MGRRGQLALVGALALLLALVALVSLRSPEPIVACERGHLQAAQLVHLARACMATRRCDLAALSWLVQQLYQLNNTYGLPLRLYPTRVVRAPNPGTISLRGRAITVTNTTTFTIATLRSAVSGQLDAVEVVVTAASEPTGRTYLKVVEGREYAMVEVRLTYSHEYRSPFFNVTLCPSLGALDGVADIKRVGACEWLVGVPLQLARPADINVQPGLGVKGYRYELVDEFGVPVVVLFRW